MSITPLNQPKLKSKFAITVSSEDLAVEHDQEHDYSSMVHYRSESLSVHNNLRTPRPSLEANVRSVKITSVEIVKYAREDQGKQGDGVERAVRMPKMHRSAVFPTELKPVNRRNKQKGKEHSCTESCTIV